MIPRPTWDRYVLGCKGEFFLERTISGLFLHGISFQLTFFL